MAKEVTAEKVTEGPWHWVNTQTDEPLGADALQGSLRTVEEFGEDKTEIIDGKSYTSFRLPKFILEAEFSAKTDAENLGNREFIVSAVNACFTIAKQTGSTPERVAECLPDWWQFIERLANQSITMAEFEQHDGDYDDADWEGGFIEIVKAARNLRSRLKDKNNGT